jgi:multisubunit Na+/H+ antiporter MnhF subunit
MIDSWLFAALCLIFLAGFAILRIIPGPTRGDQLIGVTAAITIASGAAVALSITWGNLLVLDVSIVLAALCYAGIIVYVRSSLGEAL